MKLYLKSKDGDIEYTVDMYCEHPNMKNNNTESVGCNGVWVKLPPGKQKSQDGILIHCMHCVGWLSTLVTFISGNHPEPDTGQMLRCQSVRHTVKLRYLYRLI